MPDPLNLFSIEATPNTFAMVTTIVDRGAAHPSYRRKSDLAEHLSMIELEFSGRPVIEFYHAGIIVHIRRRINSEIQMSRFLQLWNDHADFLLQNLNSRWLISACDTLADYSDDAVERAAALGATLFMNTIKLYETERLALSAASIEYAAIDGREQLFDGLSAFWLGRGNMVANLMKRLSNPFPPNLVAPRILGELVRRARTNDTVFARFASVHQDPTTKW